MNLDTQTNVPDFGIADVFADAFGAFRARFGTHVAFTAIFILAVVVMSCVVGCGLSVTAWGLASALGSTDPGASSVTMLVFGLLFYALFFGVFLLAMVVHHAFTLDVTTRTLRGAEADLSSGLRASGTRVLSHFGFAIVRFASDSIVGCVLFGAILAIGGFDALRRMGETAEPSPEEIVALVGELGLFFALAYVAWIVWVIALRGFFGLAPAVIQTESLSTFDGISRGVRLLEGRRMQFIGLRIVWGIAWFIGLCLLYAPMVLIMVIAGDGSDARGLLALLIIPYALFFYFAMFLSYAFDSALEAAFYVRLVPQAEPAPSVVEVFA